MVEGTVMVVVIAAMHYQLLSEFRIGPSRNAIRVYRSWLASQVVTLITSVTP